VHPEKAGYDVLPVWKKRLDAKTLVTTPNSDVIHAMSYLDLGRDGPIVFEAPAGLQGILLDFWQRPIPVESTAPPKRSTNSTYRAFWPSQNASCRAHQTCGCRPLSTTNSDCSSCSSRKELRTTEIDSIEPPQRHHFSTWRRPRVLMKRW